jgi:hypothetical protein
VALVGVAIVTVGGVVSGDDEVVARVTVSESVAVFPARFNTVTVMTFAPLWSGMDGTLQF